VFDSVTACPVQLKMRSQCIFDFIVAMLTILEAGQVLYGDLFSLLQTQSVPVYVLLSDPGQPRRGDSLGATSFLFP
jgi:hypothetical protein